jgi:CxC5 like cysteine cluster associated with KDZ transposases
MAHLRALFDIPALRTLRFHEISTFVHLCCLLKKDIMLPQPVSQPIDHPPDVLPRSIATFLSAAVKISPDCVDPLWNILKGDVWSSPPAEWLASPEDARLFKEYGWKIGLSEHESCRVHSRNALNVLAALFTLYPPNDHCTNSLCPRTTPLKKEQSRRVVVYLIGGGVHPAWSIHLVCPSKCSFSASEWFR